VGIANIINNSTTTSGGEIVRELVNSSDGQGLHLADAGQVTWSTPTAADFGTSDFSVEFILNQTEENTNGNYIYFSHTSGDNRLYLHNDKGANDIAVIFVNSSGSSTGLDFTLPYDMSADYGTPTHYVFTFDRDGDVTLYKNGNSVASVPISAASAINLGDGNTAVGRFGSSSTYGVLGTFYRFRTWNKLVDAKALFERADVGFADQYGRQALTDGNFPNADNWSVNDTGSGWAIGSNKATFTQTGSIYGSITQTGVFTSADVGKTVHITFEIETATASLLIGSDSADVYTGTSYQPYTVGVHTVTFTMPSGETTIGFWAGNTSPTFSLKNVGIHVEGCVSDYDLAFANPTQSLTVQDRAGAADGTASSSTAVTQVQPIIQGNLTSLAVGSAGLPAGVPADGTVRIGSATATVSSNGDDLVIANTAGHAGITIRTGNTGSSTDGALYFSDGDATAEQTAGYLLYLHDQDKMLLGTADTTRLTIDSSGVINIPNLSASSDVQTDGSKNLITSSDKRLKNDIGELTAGLDIVSNLQPHYFSWKSDETNTQQLGFYAQDVYEFLPEAAPREEITNEDGSTDYKWGFNGRPIIAALVAAVKELKAKVETLENA
jgi:hypothetical protein